MTSSIKLSLIIPVFNEEKRLKKGLQIIFKYLKQQKYSWELILVNDGSTDNTSQIIQNSLGRTLSSGTRRGSRAGLIRTINSCKNFGKGHAIRLGVKAAQGNSIIFSDIDFSVPIEFTAEFLRQLKKYDIVIGSRRLKQSKVIKHQGIFRESLGHSFTRLSNFILGLNHSDHTCGFKAFKKHAAKKLFSSQKINGWAFDSEVLFLANKFGYKVKEIPVTWKNDPLTKVNILADLINSFVSLIFIRSNNIFGKYT